MTISDALKNKKMSMYRLAKQSEVPYTTINDLCSGKTMNGGHFEELYEEMITKEQKNNDLLTNFEQAYPGTANISNVNEIISELRKRIGTQ